MRKHFFMRAVAATWMLFISTVVMAQVSIYSRESIKENDAYEVAVRCEGGEWQNVPVYACDVDMHHLSTAAFAEFDMEGKVDVRVKLLRKEVIEADSLPVMIRPTSRNIKFGQPDAQTVLFTLDRPEYVSVEFGGDRHHNLHVFANPMLSEHYTGQEPGCINWKGENAQDVFVKDAPLIYFGPGVHLPKDLPTEEIKIPSNTTVYLAPGAVVKARLIVDHAENVRIIGRGILDHPLRGVEITFSRNVLVDGLTVLNPKHYTVFGGQSEDITIRNLKTFACRGWTDGIDLMCCRRVRINDVFLRNSDDCLAFYNHRWWYWGGTDDIDVQRATLWCDFAHPVNIGTHGDDRSETGEVLQNIRIHDCDILRHKGDGMLAINCGDKNIIHHVGFDSIRIEGVERGRLTDMRVQYGASYNRAPGNSIDSVSFRNITIDKASAGNMLPSRIDDYDATHNVRAFEIKNVVIGKRKFSEKKDIIRKLSAK